MISGVVVNVTHDIVQVLEARQCLYLVLKQLIGALPEATLLALGIKQRTSASKILPKLTPHLGDHLQVYQKARAVYIGHKLTSEELLVQTLHQQPGLSPSQLEKILPMPKQACLVVLNRLLETGRVLCTFKDTRTPRLTVLALSTTGSLANREREAFHQAYMAVGQGRSFVRIHRLRTALPWSPDDFDRVLTALAADYTVELHGGDPSTLTDTDLRNSFTDTHGLLYIALSWRRSTA